MLSRSIAGSSGRTLDVESLVFCGVEGHALHAGEADLKLVF